MRALPLLVLLAAAAEIAVMIAVGRSIGVLATLGLLMLAGFLGMSLIHSTGLSISEALRRGQNSGGSAAQLATGSLLKFLAGLLLMVPGFITDAIALLLLVPPLQRLLVERFSPKFEFRTTDWGMHRESGGTIIEGEAIEIQGEIERQDKPPGRT